MSPIQFLFLIIVALLILNFIQKYVRFRREIDKIPGPKAHSILLGNLPLLWQVGSRIKNETLYNKLKYSHNYFLDLVNQYRDKGVFRMWLGPTYPIFFVANPDSAELLLTSTDNINKAGFYRFLSPWLGDGLLLAAAQIWRPRRKILTNAFHFKILENFIKVFDLHTEYLLQQMDDLISNNNNNSNNTDDWKVVDENNNKIEGEQSLKIGKEKNNRILIHDIRMMFEDFTMNVINETAMGIGLKSNNNNNNGIQSNDNEQKSSTAKDNLISNQEYCLALKQAFRRATNRIINPLNWFDIIFKKTKMGKFFFETIEKVNQYSDTVIRKRYKTLQMNNQHHLLQQDSEDVNIFLDVLLRHQLKGSTNRLSESSLRSEVNTFILGGHDTTATALTLSTLLLGHHPEIQDKARQEVEDIKNANYNEDDANNNQYHWTMADLKSMKYLEMCIKETLRLYPSIQFIGRTLTKPLLLKNGLTLPSHTQCFVPIISLHHDETYFPEPEIFKPERFEKPLKHLFSYVPFSAGPRNCIGQKYAILEIKYLLASMLLKYRFRSITRSQDVYPEFSPVYKPCIKISVEFEKI